MKVLATVGFYALVGWLVTHTVTGRWLLAAVLVVLLLSIPLPR